MRTTPSDPIWKIVLDEPIYCGLIAILSNIYYNAFCVKIMFSFDDHRSKWWRHQTETFSALLAICAGNSPVPGEFPTQRPVTRSFDVFFDLRLNKRLSKQSWDWWFETLSCLLWRHCNETMHVPTAWGTLCLCFRTKLPWYRIHTSKRHVLL